MKTVFILAVYCLLIKTSCMGHLISLAINQIFRDFYLSQNIRFDVFIYRNETNDVNEIVNGFVNAKPGEILPFKIFCVRDENAVINISQSAILMFDSFRSYQNFSLRTFLNNSYPIDFNFLVYIRDFDVKQAKNLILAKKLDQEPSIFQFSNFLLHNFSEKTLNLLTFSMFQQPKCRDWIISKINRFSFVTKHWDHQQFFPKKYKAFNGCVISILIIYPAQPAANVRFGTDNLSRRRMVASGYAVDFIKELARFLNFRIQFNAVHIFSKKFFNESSTEDDFKLHRGSWRDLYAMGWTRYFVTHHFSEEHTLILLSEPKPYSQFEKLILPFDDEVWSYLIATSTISLATVAFVKMLSKKVQTFVFGANVSSPFLNLL